MSPEAFDEDEQVDHLTDIWSVGVTFFNLLTGKHPFDPEEKQRCEGQTDGSDQIALSRLCHGVAGDAVRKAAVGLD